jgi:hypothetical protein
MQTSSNITVRLGGVAAAIGGVLWSAKAFYDRNDAPPWPTDLTDTLFSVVLVLFLLGFVGLYPRCRGRLREWEVLSSAAFVGGAGGSVGSVLAYLSVVLEVGSVWWLEFSWWMFVFGFFLTNLGLVFLGNFIAQSGAPTRWKVLPTTLGSLGILLILVCDLPNSLLGIYLVLSLWIVYGLGWMALGFDLWSYQNKPVRQSAAAR